MSMNPQSLFYVLRPPFLVSGFCVAGFWLWGFGVLGFTAPGLLVWGSGSKFGLH